MAGLQEACDMARLSSRMSAGVLSVLGGIVHRMLLADEHLYSQYRVCPLGLVAPGQDCHYVGMQVSQQWRIPARSSSGRTGTNG